MKIAFVSPNSLFYPRSRQSEDERINEFIKSKGVIAKSHSPSNSLLQLATLTPDEHEIVYLDDQYGSIDTSTQFDIAAISFMTVSADRAYELADAFRENGTHVVMGGIHPTLCPEDAAGHADTIVVGDADDVWIEFLNDFEGGHPKPLYDGGACDVLKRPPPRFDLVPRNYYYRNTMLKEMYAIHTSFGCNRSCKFCSNWKKPGWNRLHRKSIDQIRNELQLIADYSDDYILLMMDDNLFLDPEHGSRVVDLLESQGVGWMGATDISVAKDTSLLKRIRRSGCMLLAIGLESLNRDDLAWLAPWKAGQIDFYEEGLRILREEGINVLGSFIVGLDNDTTEVFKRYFDFFIENRLASAAVGILTPYPGTELRERLIEEGRLNLEAPWGDYSAFNLLFDHPTMSKEEIYDGVYWFFRRCEEPDVIEHLRRINSVR